MQANCPGLVAANRPPVIPAALRLAALNPDIDLVISDFSMPRFNGMRALDLLKGNGYEIPFIFFSGTIGEEAAIESLKNGATDYVLKQNPDRLVAAVRRALVEARERAAHVTAPAPTPPPTPSAENPEVLQLRTELAQTRGEYQVWPISSRR